MKVKDLRAILSEIPSEFDDLYILLSKDDEGNGYRQLTGMATDTFVKDDPTDWMVECIYDEDELDEDDEVTRVVVMW